MELSRFMRVYSNLPIPLRREIIAVINKQPITWNVAYIEINNKTKLGEKIFKQLITLKII